MSYNNIRHIGGKSELQLSTVKRRKLEMTKLEKVFVKKQLDENFVNQTNVNTRKHVNTRRGRECKVELPSQKLQEVNKSVLCYDGNGYFYRIDKTENNTVYLMCQVNVCRARATVGMEENSPIRLTENSPMHNHQPDFKKLNVSDFLEKVKERAVIKETSKNDIYKEDALESPKGDADVAENVVKQKLIKTRKRFSNISISKMVNEDNLNNQIDNDTGKNEVIGNEGSQYEDLPSEYLLMNELPSQNLPGRKYNSVLYYDDNGYFYRYNKTIGNTIYLFCQVNACHVRATVGVEENAPIRLTTASPMHNHQPNFKGIRVSTFLKRLRERTLNEETPINDIYREEALGNPEGAGVIPERIIKQKLVKMRKRLYKTVVSKKLDQGNLRNQINDPGGNDDSHCEVPSNSDVLNEFLSQKSTGLRHNSTIYHDGNGYYYIFSKTIGNIMYLCCQAKTCHAKASVSVEENSSVILMQNSPMHNHQPDFTRLHVSAYLERVRERIMNEHTPINDIFREEALSDLSPVKISGRISQSGQDNRFDSVFSAAIESSEELDEENFQNQIDSYTRINEDGSTEDNQCDSSTESVVMRELPSRKIPGLSDNSSVYYDDNGYFYCSKSTRKNITYLNCQLKTCLARATVSVEENAPIKLTPKSPMHNHPPDFTRLRISEFVESVRERTINEETPINNIYKEEALRNPVGAGGIPERIVKHKLIKLRKRLFKTLFSEELGEDTLENQMYSKHGINEGGSIEDSRCEIKELPSRKLPGLRHNSILYYDGSGYFYISERTIKNIMHLICQDKTCHVRATIDVEKENAPIKVSAKSPLHNHQPDFRRLHVSEFLEKLKERAVNEDTPVDNIYIEEALRDPEGAAGISKRCAKEKLIKWRKKNY